MVVAGRSMTGASEVPFRTRGDLISTVLARSFEGKSLIARAEVGARAFAERYAI